MHRFRLLGFYVVGVVVVVGLAIWGVSLRRSVAEPTRSNGGALQTALPAAPTGATSVAVSIDNFTFDPQDLAVTAGTTVTWTNASDVAHTVTSSLSPPLFDSKDLGKNEKFSFEFKTPGTYEYFCEPHPYMTGKIIVR
jgi:plastocyanin